MKNCPPFRRTARMYLTTF